ncbi:MAG TPA: hypothetical protein VHE81_10865, partial [Lacipirellulaceae bacterium]|nr:hypothetical protein [Lacipirellulaceae bacterium]
MTIGVVISLSLAAVFLVVQNIEWRSRRARLLLGIGFATTVLLAASFCVWYYGMEFHRISPDLAAAGFPGTWLDWVDTAVITGILVTAGAYRLTRHHNPHILYSENLSENSVAPAFHESVPGLTLLGFAAIVDMISWAKGIIKFTSTPGPATMWESIVALLRYPYFYLSFAVLILSIQLCWRRWSRRNDSVGWKLMAIDRAWFFWNWVRLAMLAIVGLPTLSAYSFIYWLGPWYLYGPK